MPPFIDPRDDPTPGASTPPPRLTEDLNDLDELHRLCKEHRLYEAERWIREGRPLQAPARLYQTGRRRATALELALQSGDQALTFLLLCNGYDPNLEPGCALDIPLRSRRLDLVDPLLAWGADPHDVSRLDLFDTYKSELWERFHELGVDLTAYDEMAEALAYHPGNKPLFGFARRHRQDIPGIQRQLDMALVYHADEGGQKGVSLCLWAGADPHKAVPKAGDPSSWYNEDPEDEEDRYDGNSAIHMACRRGHLDILKRLGPDPALDDFQELYRRGGRPGVITLLAQQALPHDVGAIIESYFGPWFAWEPTRNPVDLLRALFDAGAKWTSSSKEQIDRIRRELLRAEDWDFRRIVEVLVDEGRCDPSVLHELGRTATFRKRLESLRLVPPRAEDGTRGRLSRSEDRIVAAFGLPVAKRPTRLPSTAYIGPYSGVQEYLTLDRETLYEMVWARPISHVAADWGLSGPGLARPLRRLKIPLPSNVYWAKLKAGKTVRRPKLPTLRPGEAEVVIVRSKRRATPQADD